ncbi:MAG TPA: response regulator [Candidatus Nanoarchaeia archaeon]|nr:response regulator [Candidatus Nanoarchaeia archaeon]
MKPIIIAENIEILRNHLVKGLYKKFNELRIDEVWDGKELVDKIKSEDYGLIITDYHMPQKDGLEAILEIRKFNQQVSILMISGSGIKDEAINNGATEYLSKPFTPTEFLETVEKLYYRGD